jgi:asparagine synthase (glutamine-hydrolysing)
LEARVPYLDYRLVPLVLSLPEKCKIRWLKTKWLLKKIASTYLPKNLVNRPKRGFTIPVSAWIRNSGLIQEFLNNRKYYESGAVNYEYVRNLLTEHISGKRDYARELWLVFIFNYWTFKKNKK